MKMETLSAKEFQTMLIAGGQNLDKNLELINALNVFPVPDGDTGTNMSMSYNSGIDRLKQTQSDHVGELATGFAKGLLMGARGNSGVILSQIFRGFSKAIEKYEILDGRKFIKAFAGGVESAYKAVMKPVEGTILTVTRESALAGEKKANETDDIIEIMQAIVDGAQVSLDNTPELLPVLKQVGVVDSGGKGLLCIYEGFLASLTGETVVTMDQAEDAKDKVQHALFSEDEDHPMSMDDITFGFCTEIMVKIGQRATTDKSFDYEGFRNELDTKGDSLLVVADDEIIKVHIHTENPGEIMQMGQEYGELIKIKVDNMREQVRELEGKSALTAVESELSPAQELAHATLAGQKDTAVIAVAAGEGMIEMFKSIGIDYVLQGGQTMNPSTEDFVRAIEQLDAKQYILLPNNKNILMAAEQVNEVVDSEIVVVPTRSIPQAITAMIAYNPEEELSVNQMHMSEMLDEVKTGQITYAIRDTTIDDIDIKKDDFMGIIDGDIEVTNPSLPEALKETITAMLDDFSEIVTIFIGEDGSEAEVDAVVDAFEATHPDIEFELVQGDQPVYNYIIAVE